jgi:hypothetical protein
MNNTMVREIRGAKINTKSSFKNLGAQNRRGRKLREQIRYILQIEEFTTAVLHAEHVKQLFGRNVRSLMMEQ